MVNNRLWGFDIIATGTASTVVTLPTSVTKGYIALAQHANTGNATRTFATSFVTASLTVYMDVAPTNNTGFYWFAFAR